MLSGLDARSSYIASQFCESRWAEVGRGAVTRRSTVTRASRRRARSCIGIGFGRRFRNRRAREKFRQPLDGAERRERPILVGRGNPPAVTSAPARSLRHHKMSAEFVTAIACNSSPLSDAPRETFTKSRRRLAGFESEYGRRDQDVRRTRSHRAALVGRRVSLRRPARISRS